MNESITVLEERLRQAMLRSDVATLSELIDDELIFISHDGARRSLARGSRSL